MSASLPPLLLYSLIIVVVVVNHVFALLFVWNINTVFVLPIKRQKLSLFFCLNRQYIKDVRLYVQISGIAPGRPLVLAVNLVPWEIKFSPNPRLINLMIEAIIIMKKSSHIHTENVIIIAGIVEFINRGFVFFLN